MAGRNARGMGNIRKKTKVDKKTGKKYEWWEARYTAGHDPGTGKQMQRTITGKTQKEVAQKLAEVTASIGSGTYIAPSKQTVGQWLDTWADTYLGGVKPFTAVSYKSHIRNHIKPALGAVRLEALDTPTIQQFYNTLAKSGQKVPKRDVAGGIVKRNGVTVYEAVPMSPKTIKNIHGVLHKALQQAIAAGLLRFNPAGACTLPRVERPELHPLDELETKAFIEAIRGHEFETLYTVTLFTGMREGEVLGLTWDCVNFSAGTIHIKQQLQREKKAGGKYQLVPLKMISPARSRPRPLLWKCCGSTAPNKRSGSSALESCGKTPPGLCSRMRSAGTWCPGQWPESIKKWLPLSDARTPASTICATPTPWPPSAPGMTSRPCKATLAMPPLPLLWTCTATLPIR